MSSAQMIRSSTSMNGLDGLGRRRFFIMLFNLLNQNW
ncbi:hypothetical protein FOFC_20207 [Fusarium oxysporum]|nr:hypothetical protein FOFC_20207 [Fusarium oxysporum]